LSDVNGNVAKIKVKDTTKRLLAAKQQAERPPSDGIHAHSDRVRPRVIRKKSFAAGKPSGEQIDTVTYHCTYYIINAAKSQ
jgi:hypothetical protein